MRWSRAKVLSAFGVAGIVILGLGLSASLSGQGTVPATTPSATGNTATQPQISPVESPTPIPATPTPAVSQPHAPPPFFVMIDPAHGGDDPGAVFSGGIEEKDITLALARRLKTELQERGVLARLLRDTDVTLSLEQRAENANEQHAGIYVVLHVGTPGHGVRVYAPALVSLTPPVQGKFLLWESAQAGSLDRSQELAQKITAELDRKNVKASKLMAPLRPLNNVTAPAVAIELAPYPQSIQEIMSQRFQTTVVSGVAAGIAQLHFQWESRQ